MGLKAGFASLTQLKDDVGAGITAQTGFRFAFEGAYFFNRSFGVGGEIGFQSFPQKIDQAVKDEFQNEGYEIIPQAAGNRMYYAGPHYQFPFGKNSIGTKLLLGAISGPDTEIYLREFTPTGPDGEFLEVSTLHINPIQTLAGLPEFITSESLVIIFPLAFILITIMQILNMILLIWIGLRMEILFMPLP